MSENIEIEELRNQLQDIYKKLGQAHEQGQASQSPNAQALIRALENEMDVIVDQMIKLEGID